MPKVKIVIRQAKRLDCSGIESVNQESLPVVYTPIQWAGMISLKMTFVVVISGLIVGYSSCDRGGCIVSFAIANKFRRQGYARQLLSYTIENMKNAGYPSLHLRVKQSNDSAIKLYQSLQFQIQQELHNYYGIDDHAYFMVRSLKEPEKSLLASMLLPSADVAQPD